jgi:hypothetical protein
MSSRLMNKGRQYFGAGSAAWATDTFNVLPLRLDGTLTDTAVKAITAITTATPPVCTSTAHGYANGDIIVIRGAAGMLNANGTFKLGSVAANTFALLNLDGGNVVGTGTFSGTACAINLTAADFVDDFDGAFCTGAAALSAAVAIGTKTNVDGLLSGAAVSGIALNDTCHAVIIAKNVGNAAATSLPIHFCDGRTLVRVVADAASSATTVFVEPLEGPIASGQTIQMTNGVTVTLSSGAAAGARSLAVNALSGAITAGHHGDALVTGAGYPISVTSSTFTHTPDPTNGFFTL